MALAIMVFPVPGGPKNRIPLGGCNNRRRLAFFLLFFFLLVRLLEDEDGVSRKEGTSLHKPDAGAGSVASASSSSSCSIPNRSGRLDGKMMASYSSRFLSWSKSKCETIGQEQV